jgi:hypothetical protein
LLRTKPIIKDFRYKREGEEKEKLISMPEEDLFNKIKTSMILKNIDLL